MLETEYAHNLTVSPQSTYYLQRGKGIFIADITLIKCQNSKLTCAFNMCDVIENIHHLVKSPCQNIYPQPNLEEAIEQMALYKTSYLRCYKV